MHKRYLAGLYDLDELGLQLRRQGGQVGMNCAEQWIGLTDGGNGLESFLRRNFPRDLVLILDFSARYRIPGGVEQGFVSGRRGSASEPNDIMVSHSEA
ncbi:MAG: hypothetical protein U0793_24915 [Gemmataceae bacterium]